MCYPLKLQFKNEDEAEGYKRALEEIFEILKREKNIVSQRSSLPNRRISHQEAWSALKNKGMHDMAENIEYLLKDQREIMTAGIYSTRIHQGPNCPETLIKVLNEIESMHRTAQNHKEETNERAVQIHWKGVQFAADELQYRIKHLLKQANENPK